MWAREPEVVAAIRARRENDAFLPGFTLPSALHVTGDLSEAVVDADLVVFAVPAQHLRAVAGSVKLNAPLVLNVAKGLEQGTCMRMSEVLAEALPGQDPRTIGVLSGPNLAREIMSGQPAASCTAFSDPEAAVTVQRLLMAPTLRVYTSDDVIGCEIGGALKNVIAIAAGVADGLGFGMNTRAACSSRAALPSSRGSAPRSAADR